MLIGGDEHNRWMQLQHRFRADLGFGLPPVLPAISLRAEVELSAVSLRSMSIHKSVFCHNKPSLIPGCDRMQ